MLSRRTLQGVIASMVTLLLAACSAAPSRSVSLEPPLPPIEATLDADVEIVLTLDGVTKGWAPQALFDEALRRLDVNDTRGCSEAFDALWRGLEPEDEWYASGLFNAALCHQRRGDLQGASERFGALASAAGVSRLGLEARLRRAAVDARRDAWREVSETLSALEPDFDLLLEPADRLERSFRMGMAMIALQRSADAEAWFQRCLKENTLSGRAAQDDKHEFVSGCHYGKGLVYHMQFAALQLDRHGPKLRRGLQAKKHAMRRVFDQYDRVINTHNTYWMILAGYMIGKLYEDFYFDLLSVEVDPSLNDDPDALGGYFDRLRQEFEPAIDDALLVYRKTDEVNTKAGLKNTWGSRARARAAYLSSYRADAVLLREQERYIVEMGHALRGDQLSHDPRDFNCIHDPLRPAAAAPLLASKRALEPKRGQLPLKTTSALESE